MPEPLHNQRSLGSIWQGCRLDENPSVDAVPLKSAWVEKKETTRTLLQTLPTMPCNMI